MSGETTTWFRIGQYRKPIEAVEVVKVTKHTVLWMRKFWNGEIRLDRTHDRHSFFSTFEEAKSACISRAEERVRSAKLSLETAEKDLQEARSAQP